MRTGPDQRPQTMQFANAAEAKKFADARTAKGGELGGTFIFGTDTITFKPKAPTQVVTEVAAKTEQESKPRTNRAARETRAARSWFTDRFGVSD